MKLLSLFFPPKPGEECLRFLLFVLADFTGLNGWLLESLFRAFRGDLMFPSGDLPGDRLSGSLGDFLGDLRMGFIGDLLGEV